MQYKPTVYVLFSGGIDSTALIHFFYKQKYIVQPIYIDYGQKSKSNELRSVKKITQHFGIKYKVVKIQGLGKISKGEIIGRNALFVCLALMIQKKVSTGLIALGIHDGALYPDSTMSFVNYMQNILDLYTDGKVKLACPFIGWFKEDILLYCKSKKIPMEITYSCELGLNQPCGKCQSCKDLIKFLPNGQFSKK
jgi:7-cyano-7-deazaguanine synthase